MGRRIWTEDGIYRFPLRFQGWQLVQGEAVEEYFSKSHRIFRQPIEGLLSKLRPTQTVRMFSARKTRKQKVQNFLLRRRGCLAVLLLALVAMGVLLTIPVHGYSFDSATPEILSNPETGIILVPELVFASSARPTQALWCSLLGYWAPASCLFEVRATGLHIWFLRESGVEYHALEPFAEYQGEAYVYNGKLRWLLGRETWEWVDQGFRKLSRSDTALLFRDRRSLVGDVIEAEGWIRHRVDNEDLTFSLGPYRVRYSSPLVEEGPTEITIEDGPVVGKLFSRDQQTQFTWWVERVPEISVQEQQPTG